MERREVIIVGSGPAGAALPRAVVLRDSFAGALIPFLSEHFARVLYLFTEDLDPVVVERDAQGW